MKFEKTEKYVDMAIINGLVSKDKDSLGEWVYKKLKTSSEVFELHKDNKDMRYDKEDKKQLYPIADRDIEYRLSLINHPQRAVRIAKMIHPDGEIYEEFARYGVTRYYEVITEAEAVRAEIRVIGYVCLKYKDSTGEIQRMISLNKGAMNRNGLSVKEAEKKINNDIKEILA